MLQVLFYIFLVLSLVGLGGYIFSLIKLVKDPFERLNKQLFIIGLAFLAIGVGSFTFMSGFMFSLFKDVQVLDVILSILGGLIFSLSLFLFIGSFILHYYRKGLLPSFDKVLYIILITSIPVMFISFFYLFTQGMAPYLTYPLINGINFESGWTTPTGAKPTIAWYALCILSGALLVYFLCDHKMYKQYGKHGILESTFFVAFPAGIIGARLFYVIGQWEAEFASDWTRIFAIHDGGLTILGGALMGIVVGVLWFVLVKKQYSIWVAVDIILPTILIAQAVGRWGNFFNCEVHGSPVSTDGLWWIPQIVLNNGVFSSTGSQLTNGQVYLPLFYIEAMLNIFGYILIGEIIPRFFKKKTEFGDVALGYLLVYGTVRTFLEPFRDASYNMGENGYWSWVWSLMFIVGGALLIVLNHVVRYIIKKYQHKEIVKEGSTISNIITLGVILLSGLALLIPGLVMIMQNPFVEVLSWSNFNIGLFLTVLGGSVLIFIIPSLLTLKERFYVLSK